MPVSKDGIGGSQATIDKQYGLAKLFSQHFAVCENIMAKNSWVSPVYQYIDANAGNGRVEEVGCAGSPVVFLEEVASCISMRYLAHFIEIEPQNSLELCSAVSAWEDYVVITGDNKIEVPKIIEQLPNKSYGLLYTDPNGRPNFKMLAEASKKKKAEKIDFLIRYSATSVKRTQHTTDEKDKKMLDYLAEIDKKFWIVREVNRNDSWQWTFLLGLNWGGLGAWKKHRFHNADSPEGQCIIERLNYTVDELQQMRQPGLFSAPPYKDYQEYLRHPKYRVARAEAVKRSGGVCEKCGERPVTEVHHLHYPKWGTFDVVDNLQALCHECHCEIHGKEPKKSCGQTLLSL